MGIGDHIFGIIRRLCGLWYSLLIAPIPEKILHQVIGSVTTREVQISGETALFHRDPKLLPKEALKIVVGSEAALVHSFRIGKSAQKELKKVVQYEAARVMPMQLEKLSITYSIDREGASHDEAIVTIGAIKTSLYRKILQLMQREKREINSFVIKCDGREIAFKSMEIHKRKLIRRGARVALVVSALALLVTAPSVYLARLHEETDTLNERIALARQNTAKIAGLQEQLQRRQRLSTAVGHLSAGARILDMYEVVTKLSPDSVWFEEFRIELDRVYLKGRAEQPEDWALLVQGHSGFYEVVLLSVQGGRGNLANQQFELSFRVNWSELEAEQ